MEVNSNLNNLTKLTNRNILIDKERKINLKEQTLFLANGDEGLHLWESAIVFARFIIKNSCLFEGKNVIELGCGCGLLGLTCLMYTKCNNLVFSDYQDTVLKNLITNIEMNKYSHSHYLDMQEINKNVNSA